MNEQKMSTLLRIRPSPTEIFNPTLHGPHCLDLDLNGHLTRRNFWHIPGMLENYTIPPKKEFLKSREPILR